MSGVVPPTRKRLDATPRLISGPGLVRRPDPPAVPRVSQVEESQALAGDPVPVMQHDSQGTSRYVLAAGHGEEVPRVHPQRARDPYAPVALGARPGPLGWGGGGLGEPAHCAPIATHDRLVEANRNVSRLTGSTGERLEPRRVRAPYSQVLDAISQHGVDSHGVLRPPLGRGVR